MPEHILVGVYFAAFMVLVLAYKVFQRRASIRTKREYGPAFTIATGVLMFATVVIAWPGWWLAYIVVGCSVILFTWLSIKHTHVCDSCGRTLFGSMDFCPKCGAKLKS
jgi:hypothetical protein